MVVHFLLFLEIYEGNTDSGSRLNHLLNTYYEPDTAVYSYDLEYIRMSDISEYGSTVEEAICNSRFVRVCV